MPSVAVRVERLEPRAIPLMVELARLAFEMTPVLVSPAKLALPESESDVPFPLVNPKLVRVEDAVEEVAINIAEAI